MSCIFENNLSLISNSYSVFCKGGGKNVVPKCKHGGTRITLCLIEVMAIKKAAKQVSLLPTELSLCAPFPSSD